MNREVLILQHVPWERPALLGEALTEQALTWRQVNVTAATERAALPTLDGLAGVVILGGPMGALDTGQHPGLALEARLVREAVSAGLPLLGVCLGHQLIATALGAPLHRAAAAEFGIGSIDILVDDAVFGPAGHEQPVLHWHRDVVDAPDGATVLASTAGTPNQAFRIADTVFSTQFHLEADERLLGEWLAQPEMAADLGDEVRERIVADFSAVRERMRELADRAFGAFARAALTRL